MVPELLPLIAEVIANRMSSLCSALVKLPTTFQKDGTTTMDTAKLIVSIVAAILAGYAIYVSKTTATKLKERDIDIDKRKVFITALWDKIIAVKQLTRETATPNRVKEVLNTLELVALCWDNDVVDKELVALAFGKNYGLRIKEIKGIVVGKGYDDVIKKLGTDGPGMLKQYPTVEPVGSKIEKELEKKTN
jgi:hypothetical protein